MNIVCDTNIWYEIAFGETDATQLKSDGHRLLATPLSLLELSSKIDETNFSARSGAAKAVVEHADEILPDPEHHLAAIWQVDAQYDPFDWKQGICTLANAKDVSELQSGVIDFDKQIQMKVNVSYATNWRTDRYDKFVEDMLKVINTFWPGYEAARLAGRATHMPREMGELFDKATSYPDQIKQYVLATYARATCLPQGAEIPMPDQGVLDAAVSQLTTYATIYQKYVVRLATFNTPKPNDLGDLECFLYAQDGRRIFTKDKNWLVLAKDAGCEDCLYAPSAS